MSREKDCSTKNCKSSDKVGSAKTRSENKTTGKKVKDCKDCK